MLEEVLGNLSRLEGRPAGGLWILEANDAAEAGRLVREDPFWDTGLRKSVRVLEWRKVYDDRARVA